MLVFGSAGDGNLCLFLGQMERVALSLSAVGAMDSVSDFESGGCGFESRIAYFANVT